MPDINTFLSLAGVLIGGIVAGFVGARKTDIFKNGKRIGGDSNHIEKSMKTSGAKHISEEGLDKFDRLNETLQAKYMSMDKHADVCGKQQSDMKLYISNELKRHTSQILSAIGNMRYKSQGERG